MNFLKHITHKNHTKLQEFSETYVTELWPLVV